MAKQRYTHRDCIQCGMKFSYNRADAQFCSDRCGAAWARAHGYEREDFHAAKEEWIKRNCAWCQTIFSYNEYAKRAGQRVPQYCSNACRQAAYRARKQATGQPSGYTGNWTDARNDKTNKTGKGTSHDKKNDDGEYEYSSGYKGKGTQQNAGNKGTQQDTNKGTQQKTRLDERWKSKDVYLILGVTYLSTAEEIKRAWKKLLRTYHPDVSKETNAGEISKVINWAYDKLTNPRARR